MQLCCPSLAQCHTNLAAVFHELEDEPDLFGSAANLAGIVARAGAASPVAGAAAGSDAGNGSSGGNGSGTERQAQQAQQVQREERVVLLRNPPRRFVRPVHRTQKLLGMVQVLCASSESRSHELGGVSGLEDHFAGSVLEDHFAWSVGLDLGGSTWLGSGRVYLAWKCTPSLAHPLACTAAWRARQLQRVPRNPSHPAFNPLPCLRSWPDGDVLLPRGHVWVRGGGSRGILGLLATALELPAYDRPSVSTHAHLPMPVLFFEFSV